MKESIALTLLLALAYLICVVAACLYPDNAVGYGLFAVLCWCCGMWEATACEALRRHADLAPYWRQA